MDEGEKMIGMSDEDSNSSGGDGGGAESGVEEMQQAVENGALAEARAEFLAGGLGHGDDDDGIVEDEEDEEDDEVDDSEDGRDIIGGGLRSEVTAASALSELVGSVGQELVGVLGGIGGGVGGGLGGLSREAMSCATISSVQQLRETENMKPPTRYLQVEGYDGRKNDIIFCTPLREQLKEGGMEGGGGGGGERERERKKNGCGGGGGGGGEGEESSSSESSSSSSEGGDEEGKGEDGGDGENGKRLKLLLFFGGDIQDFPEMMEQHRDHRNYVQFNLESTALQLQRQFPDSHVAVVRPSRIQMLTFSCYDNFVHCNHTGAPEHVITHHSLHHLELLLQNLSKRILNGEGIEGGGGGVGGDSSKHGGDGGGHGLNIQIKKELRKDRQSSRLMMNCKENSVSSSASASAGEDDSTVSSTTTEEKGNGLGHGHHECSNSNSNGSGSRFKSKEGKVEGKDKVGEETKGGKEEDNKKKRKLVRLDRADISLVGFSKGCVVLNQLLYEFHYLKTLTPDDLSMNDFLHCIKDMYWLDGGHNGGKNTWITSRSLLETLTRLGVRIHVHLTPYQLLDDRRPWIRKEEKMFSELLKKFSAPIIRQIHFENETPCLQQHLRIIADFNMHPLTIQQQQNQQQQPTSLLHNIRDEVHGGGDEGGSGMDKIPQSKLVVGGGGGVGGGVGGNGGVDSGVDGDSVSTNHENNIELEH